VRLLPHRDRRVRAVARRQLTRTLACPSCAYPRGTWPGWRNGRRRRLKPAGPARGVGVRLPLRAHVKDRTDAISGRIANAVLKRAPARAGGTGAFCGPTGPCNAVRCTGSRRPSVQECCPDLRTRSSSVREAPRCSASAVLEPHRSANREQLRATCDEGRRERRAMADSVPTDGDGNTDQQLWRGVVRADPVSEPVSEVRFHPQPDVRNARLARLDQVAATSPGPGVFAPKRVRGQRIARADGRRVSVAPKRYRILMALLRVTRTPSDHCRRRHETPLFAEHSNHHIRRARRRDVATAMGKHDGTELSPRRGIARMARILRRQALLQSCD
jgi:hypothetical protein